MLDAIRSIDAIACDPIPANPLANVFLSTLISRSVSNASTGVKIRVFLPSVSTSALKSPSLFLLKVVFFSKRYELSVVDCKTNSVICASPLSGATI